MEWVRFESDCVLELVVINSGFCGDAASGYHNDGLQSFALGVLLWSDLDKSKGAPGGAP
jgi:hypothetical protein